MSELIYKVGDEVRSIPRSIGKYEIKEYIDSGKFGDVFRALYVALNKLRAFKICRNPTLDPEKFWEEAARMADINSPNIVHIYECGMPPEFPFAWYTMELVEGKTLRDMIEDKSIDEWGFEDKAHCFNDILCAINLAWTTRVPHYDLHTGNIKFVVDPFRVEPTSASPVIPRACRETPPGYHILCLATRQPKYMVVKSTKLGFLRHALPKMIPKILDFGIQLSGQMSHSSGEGVLPHLLDALNQILKSMFRAERGFIELWQEEVMEQYDAIDDMPDISAFIKCFDNIKSKFLRENERVRQIHDEFLQSVRLKDEKLAIYLLIQLSTTDIDELSKFYGSSISAFATLKDFYAKVYTIYNDKEISLQYYEDLSPYKETLPEILRKNLSFREVVLDIKYLEDDQSNRPVREKINIIVEHREHEEYPYSIIGYSHLQKKLKIFRIDRIQEYFVASSPLAYSDTVKKRRIDKTKLITEQCTDWELYKPIDETVFRDAPTKDNIITEIARDFGLSANSLENYSYVTKLIDLLDSHLQQFDDIDEYERLCLLHNRLKTLYPLLLPLPKKRSRYNQSVSKAAGDFSKLLEIGMGSTPFINFIESIPITEERAMGTLEDSGKLLILAKVNHLMECLAHDFFENKISGEKFKKKRAMLEEIYQCQNLVNTKKYIEDLHDTGKITTKEMKCLLPEEKGEAGSENTFVDTYYDKIIKNLYNLKKVAFFHPRIAFLGVASEIENVFREIDRLECPNLECKNRQPFHFGNILNGVPDSVLKLYCEKCNTLLFEYVIPDPGEPYFNSITELIDSSKIKNVTTDLIKVIKEVSEIYYYYACGEEEEHEIMVNLLDVISSFQYESSDESEQDRRRKAAFSVLTETAQELLKYCYDLDEKDEKEITDTLAKAKTRALQREFDDIVALARARAKIRAL